MKDYKIIRIRTTGCDLYLSRDPTGTRITAPTLEQLKQIIKERDINDRSRKNNK